MIGLEVFFRLTEVFDKVHPDWSLPLLLQTFYNARFEAKHHNIGNLSSHFRFGWRVWCIHHGLEDHALDSYLLFSPLSSLSHIVNIIRNDKTTT